MEKCYRKNAGIVVFNREGKVFMAARSDHPGLAWQFPQGGIEEGESIPQAAKRELYEETGIRSVTLVNSCADCIRYDFPAEILEKFKKRGRLFCGQEQYWNLFYFDGNEDEINFEINPQEIEFKSYQWVDLWEAPHLVVDWKAEAYRMVAEKFAPLMKEYLDRRD